MGTRAQTLLGSAFGWQRKKPVQLEEPLEARNESGKTYEDKVRDAMVLYEETIGAAFTMYSL